MPDRRKHRGPHPEDAGLWDARSALAAAAADLCWLLSRDYAPVSSLKLVGDHYQLTARQRTAVARCCCSDAQLESRGRRMAAAESVRGRAVWLDGYNVLTTVEAALSGGVLLACRDGTYRDLASMHGSFRKVTETAPALALIGRSCAELGIARAVWLLDRPVSNSGRLKTLMGRIAEEHGWEWEVQLVSDPDRVLAQTAEVAATADSVVLDRCAAWLNLAREVVQRHVPNARVLELFGS